jgi:hypothetical protein
MYYLASCKVSGTTQTVCQPRPLGYNYSLGEQMIPDLIVDSATLSHVMWASYSTVGPLATLLVSIIFIGVVVLLLCWLLRLSIFYHWPKVTMTSSSGLVVIASLISTVCLATSAGLTCAWGYGNPDNMEIGVMWANVSSEIGDGGSVVIGITVMMCIVLGLMLLVPCLDRKRKLASDIVS